jgi:hypothetical protein
LPGAAAAAAKVEDAAGVEQVKECSLAYRRSLLLQQQRSDRMKILMGKVREGCGVVCRAVFAVLWCGSW